MEIVLDKTALENGDSLFFETQDKDDIRGCEVSLNSTGLFTIEFNGAFIHFSKGFQSLQSRFNKLNDKWKLEPINNNEA